MDALVPAGRFVLMKQLKEGVEILLGFQTRNRFEIKTEDGRLLGHATEESGGLAANLLRNLVGTMRACRITFLDSGGREVGSATKPFRWYFHRLEVHESGRLLGSIERRFSWITAHLEVRNAAGDLVARVQGQGLKIWTYHITDPTSGQEIATIRKKWGGGLTEVFTNADSFGIEFLSDAPSLELKKLLIAAVFLLDLVAFERS